MSLSKNKFIYKKRDYQLFFVWVFMVIFVSNISGFSSEKSYLDETFQKSLESIFLLTHPIQLIYLKIHIHL